LPAPLRTHSQVRVPEARQDRAVMHESRGEAEDEIQFQAQVRSKIQFWNKR
jgi:hypothetical protein